MERTTAVVRALRRWFDVEARELPWRQTRDPYAIWISEVMLQQTTVTVVVPYFTRWMKELPTVAELAAEPLERVLKLWEGLGYYRRARHLHQAARLLVENHGGRVPHQFDAVLALPGIGRYTAGAICSLAFDQPQPVLDGNVIRVLTRLGGIRADPRRAETRQRLWALATELVTAAAATRRPGSCGRLNEALMELGATCCTPRNPQCAACPLRRLCTARKKNLTERIPFIPRRVRPTVSHRVALVLEQAGRVLVRHQPATGVNGGLWEFPQAELRPGQSVEDALRELAGGRLEGLLRLGRIQHSITRYRILLEVFRCRLGRGAKAPPGCWQTRAMLQRLPLSSAHRRIADRLATSA